MLIRPDAHSRSNVGLHGYCELQVNYTHAMRIYDPELQMMHQVIDE